MLNIKYQANFVSGICVLPVTEALTVTQPTTDTAQGHQGPAPPGPDLLPKGSLSRRYQSLQECSGTNPQIGKS